MPVLVRQADALRKALTARAAEDAQSYEAVVAAHRMPKETLEEREARSAAIQISLSGAACAPLMTARDALEVLRLAETAAHSGNSSTLSDAGTALYLASAAFEGAVMNVRINAVQMSDQQEAAAMMDEVAELRGQFNEVFAAARQAVDDRW
jgi:formiminotetrahydrofolate cyclodeaminase